MRIPLDTDAGYEAFQFWWMALFVHARPDPAAATARLALLEGLRQKLAKVSMATVAGGRVLREPCALELSDEERLATLEALATTPWKGHVLPHVESAIRALGAEVSA